MSQTYTAVIQQDEGWWNRLDTGNPRRKWPRTD